MLHKRKTQIFLKIVRAATPANMVLWATQARAGDGSLLGNALAEVADQSGFTTVGRGEAQKRFGETLGLIVSIVLSFLGVIFMILMIYGGYLWMTARGNEQQVEQGKTIIRQAIIGLFVIVTAYAITRLVQYFVGSTQLIKNVSV